MNTRLMIEATKANKAGDCTVYVEVSVSKKGAKKKTVRIPTNIKVKAKSWSPKSQTVIRGRSGDYNKINKMLLAKLEQVNDIIAELSQRGRFELPEIKQLYFKKNAPITLGFFAIYDGFLLGKEKSMSRNGIKDFKTLRTHLLGFEKERKRKITLSDIGISFFEEFEYYLSQLEIKTKSKDSDDIITKPFADSTILKNLQTLRIFLNNQKDKGMPVNPSYKNFKIVKKKHPELVTLEENEYWLLLNKVENERLEKVRQLFVLQCSTGLRYSDVIRIRKNHIRNNRIHITTIKTEQSLSIPLNEHSKEILYGCNFDTSTISISNQKYNDYIKELCEHVGINQPFEKTSYRGNKPFPENLKKYEIMSSHHGRRFFITQSLINGVRAEVIMKMTGHSDFRSFEKYIAVTGTDKEDAMDTWSKRFSKTDNKH